MHKETPFCQCLQHKTQKINYNWLRVCLLRDNNNWKTREDPHAPGEITCTHVPDASHPSHSHPWCPVWHDDKGVFHSRRSPPLSAQCGKVASAPFGPCSQETLPETAEPAQMNNIELEIWTEQHTKKTLSWFPNIQGSISMSFFHSLVKRIIDVLLMSTLHVRGSEGLKSLFAHTVTEMSNNSASVSRPALFQRVPKHISTFCKGIFCHQTWIFVGRMYVHQQSRVTVASDSLVHWRESIFGAKVNMSPSLHQHSDGLTSTGFTLHSKGQGCFCQKQIHYTFIFKDYCCGSRSVECPFLRVLVRFVPLLSGNNV